MGGLGWQVEKKKNLHPCGLRPLSKDEQAFLLLFCDRFSELSKNYEALGTPDAKGEAARLLLQVLEQEGIEADNEQVEYLSQSAMSRIFGFAPLDSMLCDSSLEEIAIIGIGKPIWVFVRKQGWQKTDASITCPEYMVHLINKMARPLGRRITYQSPRINAVLPDGSRLHATIPPLSAGELTVRLHSAKRWPICEIIASKSASAHALSFLWLAFQSDSSVLIAGNTASGKTTLLNSLFSFVHLNERVIQIEETPEIKIPHAHHVTIVSSDDISISMPELVRDSLRMRPDRVIVGEVRSPSEAQAFCETLLSGQARGSYATFHAQSAPEALRRLENLGVPKDNLDSLDFIIVQRRLARYDSKSKEQTEIRRMISVHLNQKDSSPLEIFSYCPKKDILIPSKNLDLALEFICARLGISFEEARLQYDERAKFLSGLKCDDFEGCVRSIQRFSYGGE